MNSGIFLIDKNTGITSFKSLSLVKKNVNKKTGHCGTLDSFASGLMIVLSGWCTKLVPIFMGMNKEYIAKIKFGIQTDTLDPEGKIIKQGNIPNITTIKKALKHFEGQVMQIPPKYSAIHVDGKRAYKSVRAGIDVEIPARNVTFLKNNLIDYSEEQGILTIKTLVSKGTYIRSFARDLGEKCNSCAHVVELKRTAIGPFSIEEAIKAEEAKPQTEFISVLKRIGDFKEIEINQKEKERFDNGIIPFWINKTNGYGLILNNNELLGIINLEEKKIITKVN